MLLDRAWQQNWQLINEVWHQNWLLVRSGVTAEMAAYSKNAKCGSKTDCSFRNDTNVW